MAKKAPVGRPKKTQQNRESEARRVAFANAFVKDLNVTSAAIAAGCSEKTAPQAGSRMLADPRVQSLIAERQARTAARNDLTVDMVIQELKRIGFADPRKLFDNNGNLIAIQDLDDDTAASIAGIEVEVETSRETGPDGVEKVTTVTRTHKVKRHDKIAALVKLGQHLGMWKNLGPKVVNNVTINQTVEMRQQAVDAEFKEILGSVDPVPLAAPADKGSRAEVVSGTAAPGRRKVGRARPQG